MILLAVSLSKNNSSTILAGACHLKFCAKNFSSMISYDFWSNPADKKEFKARRQLLNDLRWHGTSSSQPSKEIPTMAAIKHINIQTCGPLYEKWSETRKPYAGAPKEGLTFNVEYVDTKEFVDSDKAPVVLTLHGSPGSHRDFHPLINHLTPKGVRLIAPNWPEYSAIDQTEYFRHSTAEKKTYLKDFLEAINVDKLDMLVAHSSAVYPALDLVVDECFPVRFVTLLSPAGHRRSRGLRPAFLFDILSRCILNPIGRDILRKIGGFILTLQKSKTRITDVDDTLIGVTVLYLSEWQNLSRHLKVVGRQKRNLLLIYSENDSLIEKEIFLEMGFFLGAKKDHYTRYDAEANCITQGNNDDWLKIIQFTKGGHWPHLKYTNIVHQIIEKPLRV